MINKITLLSVPLVLAQLLCAPSILANDAPDLLTPDLFTPKNLTQIQTQVATLKDNPQPFTLNVYFDNNSDVVKDQYKTLLNNIVTALSETDSFTLKIAIVGHTDNKASNDYNLALGHRRAMAVSDVLTPQLGKNFAITHLTSQGEEDPLNNNQSQHEQALNRRVAIVFEPHSLPKASVTLSGSGSTLMVNEEQKLVIWDTQAQCPQNILPINNDKIYASAISPNGRLALSGGENKLLTLWDIATASPLAELAGHQGPISAVAFDLTNRLAISGSLDRQVKVWDLTKRVERFSLVKHQATVTAVALSNNGKYVASADAAGQIIVWNMLNQAIITSTKAHDSRVSTLAFTGDSKTLISAAQDQNIHLWSLFDEKTKLLEADVEAGIGAKITNFDVSDDDQRILASYDNGDIIQWSISTGKPMMTIEKTKLSLIAVSYLNKGDLIMAIDKTNNIHLWDSTNGTYIEHFATQNWESHNDFPKPPPGQSDQPFTWQDPHSNMQFSWVAPACYEMGCGAWNQQCSASEQPVHQVCLDGYWMAQHEVSQKQWTDLMGYNPSKTSPQQPDRQPDNQPDSQCDPEDEACLNSPVNQISWRDTQLYLCKLNRHAGQIYRLPTEAQWEYACRDGGKKIAHSPLPPEDADEPIGGGRFGLFNMNSGVWEWTLDAYATMSYQAHQRHQPVYPGEKSYHFMDAELYRTLRGGSWDRGASLGQCSSRHYDEPQARMFFGGFRLIKPASIK